MNFNFIIEKSLDNGIAGKIIGREKNVHRSKKIYCRTTFVSQYLYPKVHIPGPRFRNEN